MAEGFIRTFLERDIPQLGITIPDTAMRRFWTTLSHLHGQKWNSSDLGRSMSLLDKTVRHYLDILTATYMVKEGNKCMNPTHEADSIKVKNVVDMAITFTAMIRVFEEGSKKKIVEHLEQSFDTLVGVTSKNEFDAVHSEFCEWFVKNIATASKTLKNKKEKKSQSASYGHAAKVFDIAVKVYVHYCHLPSYEAAVVLLPLLHGAVDTPIMKNLKSRYPHSGIKSETIESVGISEYTVLQGLVEKHIQEEFKSEIFPAQYDDILWHRLNRKS